MKIHTLLNYDRDCAEAFRFYEEDLGGKIKMMMTHGDAPFAKHASISEGRVVRSAKEGTVSTR